MLLLDFEGRGAVCLRKRKILVNFVEKNQVKLIKLAYQVRLIGLAYQVGL